MNIFNFKEKDLPIEDLETIGLAANGQLLMNADNLKALLSGRRTGLIELHDLEGENVKIKSINAKISLKPNKRGKLDLMIHPIYKDVIKPDFLAESEADELIKGEMENFLKITIDNKGNKKEKLVEYDPETREFIVSDVEKILVPDMVNNEFLTPAQKENYKRGKEVKLAEGTTFNYSAAEMHGMRADKIALVASLLIDGGLTYMIYKGLNALFNRKRDEKNAGKLSHAYYNAIADIENQHGYVPHFADRSYPRTDKRR